MTSASAQPDTKHLRINGPVSVRQISWPDAALARAGIYMSLRQSRQHHRAIVKWGHVDVVVHLRHGGSARRLDYRAAGSARTAGSAVLIASRGGRCRCAGRAAGLEKPRAEADHSARPCED